jgi:hypothetical protein
MIRSAKKHIITAPRDTEAVDFLESLYPRGPWVLTAIEPDGPTATQTFRDAEKARHFIVSHNSAGRNLYYSLNRTRGDLRSGEEIGHRAN